MKKIFIVMLLVIASGLWNSTNGACMVPAKSNSDLPTISVSGELQERGYPCEPGEMCPTCLTPALETDNGIYYLTTTDAEIEAQLDSLFNYLYSINCICTFPTRVTGTTYQNGSFKYINISHIETGDPQPVSQENKVKSHATQWFGIQYHHDYPQSEHTPIITGITYNLGLDTLINTKLYRQIRYTNESKKVTNAYHGAIRQSEDRQEVYYIPSGIDKEYLLYNFDVEQGDTVYAYAGFYDASCVEMIEYEQHQSITPAWIVQDIQVIDGRKHITVQQDAHVVEWIEGIGTKHILWPVGRGCYATGMEVQFHHTLCAADNEGNTIYSFDTDYIGIRNNCPDWAVLSDADTIPLYTGDDPGSSTVDPIDPNQVVVTLNGNELNIKESSGDEINYTLVLNKNKQAPAKEQTVQDNSFIHSVSIELTESGYYTLRLTNPKWTNNIVGHFQYINTAIEEVQGDEKCNAKILRDGQLLIRVGERLYTPTGMQIQ